MVTVIAALVMGFSHQTPVRQGCIDELARLVGGHWEGKMGGATIIHRYESILGGKAIHDLGSVTVNSKVILDINVRYGWDDTAKLTYYLDVHNHDQVYFGHVINANGTLKFHFTDLCKPGKEYDSSLKFIDDDNVEVKVDGATAKLHRIKD